MSARTSTAATLPLLILAAGLSSCDSAKKFIDPSGKAYDAPPDTASKSAAPPSEKSAAANAPAPAPTYDARPAAATQRDVPPLSAESAIRQAAAMLLDGGDGWIEFHAGRARSRGRDLTLWGPSEVPWGMAIVDLDQDGAEDAVFAVRSTSRADTSWTLAVLADRSGKLQCIQSIPMPGPAGVVSLEGTQGGVLASMSDGDRRLYGWVGGQLVGN